MEVGSHDPSNGDSDREFAKVYDSALKEFIASSATGRGPGNLVSSSHFPDHTFKERSQSATVSNIGTSDATVKAGSQFPILPSYESFIPPADPNVQSGLQRTNVQEAFDDLIVLEDGMVTSAPYTNNVSRDAAEQFQQSHFPLQEPSASALEGFAPVVSQFLVAEKTNAPAGINTESIAFSSAGGLCLPVGNSVLPEVAAVVRQAEIQPPLLGHSSLSEVIVKPFVTEASIDQPLAEQLPGPGEVIEPSAEWPTSEEPPGPGVVEPYISQQAMHESSGPTQTNTKDSTTTAFEPPEIQAVVDELPASLREANVLEPSSVPTEVADELPVSKEGNKDMLTTGSQDGSDALTSNQARSDQLPQGKPSEQGVSEENVQPLKGQKVRKKFGNKYYLGDIVDYDPENQWFKIIYEDGDEEDLEMAEVKAILHAPSTVTLASKKRMSSEVGVGEEKNKGFKKQRKEQNITPQKKSKGGRQNKGRVTTSRKNGEARRLKASKGKPKIPRKSMKMSGKGKSPISRGQETGSAAKQIGLKRKANRDEVIEGTPRCSKVAAPVTEKTALVGTTFKKDFSGTLYSGVIEKYNKVTKYYKVKYEDGDQEDLEWDELEPLLDPVDKHADDSKQLEAKATNLKSKPNTKRAK